MRQVLMLAAAATVGLSMASPAMADADTEPEAITVEEEIVVQGRRNLSRQVKNGFAAFRAGDFKKAESYFYRVRAGYQLQASLNFEAFSDMWSFANTTGAVGVNSNQADQEVRRAIAIIHYMEGMSQRAQGEFWSARRSFKRAVALNPAHFDARADLSLVEIERGAPEKAEKHIVRLASDLADCSGNAAETCDAIRDRLWQVETAYGKAVSG